MRMQEKVRKDDFSEGLPVLLRTFPATIRFMNIAQVPDAMTQCSPGKGDALLFAYQEEKCVIL